MNTPGVVLFSANWGNSACCRLLYVMSETTASMRSSYPAARSEIAPPYEPPAIAIRGSFVPSSWMSLSCAAKSINSLTSLTSNSGEFIEINPPLLPKPRAVYEIAMNPASASFCARSAVARLLPPNPWARITAGAGPLASGRYTSVSSGTGVDFVALVGPPSTVNVCGSANAGTAVPTATSSAATMSRMDFTGAPNQIGRRTNPSVAANA